MTEQKDGAVSPETLTSRGWSMNSSKNYLLFLGSHIFYVVPSSHPPIPSNRNDLLNTTTKINSLFHVNTLISSIFKQCLMLTNAHFFIFLVRCLYNNMYFMTYIYIYRNNLNKSTSVFYNLFYFHYSYHLYKIGDYTAYENKKRFFEVSILCMYVCIKK